MGRAALPLAAFLLALPAGAAGASWAELCAANAERGAIAFCAEGPLWVNEAERSDEAYAAELKAMLDRALERAFAIADGKN